ncbi:hypothetical protein KAU11_10230 [Candidatus Babeliales bacterium]|nr:hypothetical protein [Candidatus Babeliales bacterium]
MDLSKWIQKKKKATTKSVGDFFKQTKGAQAKQVAKVGAKAVIKGGALAGAGAVGASKAKEALDSNVVKYKRETPQKDTRTVITGEVRQKPQAFNDRQARTIGGVIFGEANNDIEEMKKILSIAQNRAVAKGTDVFDEMVKAEQFQAVGEDQYQDYVEDTFQNKDAREKADKARVLVQQLIDGTFRNVLPDDVLYYGHKKPDQSGYRHIYISNDYKDMLRNI